MSYLMVKSTELYNPNQGKAPVIYDQYYSKLKQKKKEQHQDIQIAKDTNSHIQRSKLLVKEKKYKMLTYKYNHCIFLKY